MTWTWDYEASTEGYYHIYSDSDYVITFYGLRTSAGDAIAHTIVTALNAHERVVDEEPEPEEDRS